MYVVFQTKQMIDVLQNFPEVLNLDFTYKTNKYLLPLLTVMAVDGEGHGLPALHAFVKKEDTEFIAKCLTALSSKYDTGLTCCFMVGKDFAEISALELMFPDVPNFPSTYVTFTLTRPFRDFFVKKCPQMLT